MQELILAAFIGLSLGNSWLCLFMAFGMSTVELRSGMWFLFGRTLGLVILGVIIITAGIFLNISPKMLQAIAGILAVGFGSVLIGQHTIASRRRKGRHQSGHGCGGRESVKNGECGKKRGPKGSKLIQTGECENDPEVRGLNQKNKRAFGFGLGVFRGITPCFKIIILAPLMVAVPFGTGIAMVLVFVAVSMVYPLIGYLSAGAMHNLIRNRNVMLILGGTVMIIIGIYYIFESLQSAGVHVPGSGGGL